MIVQMRNSHTDLGPICDRPIVGFRHASLISAGALAAPTPTQPHHPSSAARTCRPCRQRTTFAAARVELVAGTSAFECRRCRISFASGLKGWDKQLVAVATVISSIAIWCRLFFSWRSTWWQPLSLSRQMSRSRNNPQSRRCTLSRAEASHTTVHQIRLGAPARVRTRRHHATTRLMITATVDPTRVPPAAIVSAGSTARGRHAWSQTAMHARMTEAAWYA